MVIGLIKVEVLFTSSAIGTQILLKGEEEDILVDAGDGVLRDLVSRNYDFSRLSGILITHEHIDHCCGLLPLCYFMAQLEHTKPLRIVAPSGGGKVSGLVSLSTLLPLLEVERAKPNCTIVIGSFTIEPFKVDHTVDAVGYAVSDKGGYKVVVSGDTRVCPELEKQLSKANVAVLDATFPDCMESDAYLHGHMTEGQALKIAASVEVKIFIHKMDLNYYKKMSCRKRSPLEI